MSNSVAATIFFLAARDLDTCWRFVILHWWALNWTCLRCFHALSKSVFNAVSLLRMVCLCSLLNSHVMMMDSCLRHDLRLMTAWPAFTRSGESGCP